MSHADAAPANALPSLLQTLLDKEAIRELALLYSRAIDRKDFALLRDLYTEDATDTHGDSYDGDAAGFCDYLAEALPHVTYSGHHVCNHLISVAGDVAHGEVYALALHCMPDGQDPGQRVEDLLAVRYLDQYRRCADGKWRFARRLVTYDMHMVRPFTGDGLLGGTLPQYGPADPSYAALAARLFQPGARA